MGRRRTRERRKGLASLEVVLATGIALPVFFFLTLRAIRACENLFHVIGALVGWPIL